MQHSDFQAGWLVLKSSAGERAWFLKEGSEPRNKLILLAGKNQRAEEPACLMKVGSDQLYLNFRSAAFMNNQDSLDNLKYLSP